MMLLKPKSPTHVVPFSLTCQDKTAPGSTAQKCWLRFIGVGMASSQSIRTRQLRGRKLPCAPKYVCIWSKPAATASKQKRRQHSDTATHREADEHEMLRPTHCSGIVSTAYHRTPSAPAPQDPAVNRAQPRARTRASRTRHTSQAGSCTRQRTAERFGAAAFCYETNAPSASATARAAGWAHATVATAAPEKGWRDGCDLTSAPSSSG